MDVYGHLFPSEAEEVAHRLDARHRAEADSVVPLVRPIEAQPTSLGEARSVATTPLPCELNERNESTHCAVPLRVTVRDGGRLGGCGRLPVTPAVAKDSVRSDLVGPEGPQVGPERWWGT